MTISRRICAPLVMRWPSVAKPPTLPNTLRTAADTGFVGRERSCTEKVTYTHDEAIRARAGMAKGKRSRRMAIYKCRFCGLYHLTSV